MIREATTSDIEDILQITKACATHMITKNIFQWNNHYPNKNAFLKDLMRNELYVFESQNTIIGCITISSFMDEKYLPISWLTPNENNIYIHRLAIHPEYQGKGYAQKLMNFAENYSKENKYESIRLDTFSQNKRNQYFYELRGYKCIGEIYFPKQSEHPFYC
jgi:ribosomal protein S18 acetylase RimI-like enzyme